MKVPNFSAAMVKPQWALGLQGGQNRLCSLDMLPKAFLCCGLMALLFSLSVPARAAPAVSPRQAPAHINWRSRPDDKRLSMDERADRKRDEFIRKLSKLLPTVSEGPAKAEYIFRLSEAYWKKSKHKQLQAMQIWDQQLEAWHAGGRKGPEPALNELSETKRAEALRREALKLYNRILDTYPNYPRKDEVLYNLGSSLYESGEKREGIKKYIALVREFPRSDYVADAWLELGEHFFAANKLSKAMKAYRKAAETKKPRIYSFALYKLAWCDYNIGEYEQALKKFRTVVTYSRGQQSKQMNQRDRVQLIEEALSDMVRAYSHLDALDDAFEYYQKQVGQAKSYGYLRSLAKLYDAEGKYALVVRTYERLNADYPYNAAAAENQAAIMHAYAQADRKGEVRKAVRRLVKLYAPRSVWARKNAGHADVVARAAKVVEEQLAGLVTEQHRAAQETKLVATYRLARDIYSEYLSIFPKSPNSYKFRFFYAEILFELKQYPQAALAYDEVIKANMKGEFTKHAAYNAILAWEKSASGVRETLSATKKIREQRGRKNENLKALEKFKKFTKDKGVTPTALSEVEQNLANACDRFVRAVPKDPDVVKVKFKSARLYYIHNQFEEAASRFGEIIERWPKDRLARVSAESIVQSFNFRKDWSQLNRWSRTFSQHRQLMSDRAFAKTIRQFMEGASFNEIHFVFEPKSSPRKIADLYSAFVVEFPSSPYAMVALFNAVVNYDKANVLDKSLKAVGRLLSHYKGFKLQPSENVTGTAMSAAVPAPAVIRERALFMAATFHERLAEFPQAALLYEQYATEFPRGKRYDDALFNAGLLREGLAEYDRALINLRGYAQNQKARDLDNIEWRIGLILEKKNDHAGAATLFSAFARRMRRRDPARAVCAEYRAIQAGAAQRQDMGKAYVALLKSYSALSGEQKSRTCALSAAAEASFRLLDPDFNAYMDIKLSALSGKRLERALLKKLGLIDGLTARYTAVLALGQADYGIAALYRIGEVYQEMATEIFSAQCPRALTDDQCGMYQAALQDKAMPLEDKSIEAFNTVLRKAYELRVYNEWLLKAQKALSKSEPTRFPKEHRVPLMQSEATFEKPSLMELR